MARLSFIRILTALWHHRLNLFTLSPMLLVVLCTFPNPEAARATATILVTEKLAACVNLCPGVESIYRWEGGVETSSEVLALMKTTAAGYAALQVRLNELHPYDTPEIVALPAHRALAAYAGWVAESVAVR